MTPISDIKLIRTDTTLDLSQKAEKGMICWMVGLGLYSRRSAQAWSKIGKGSRLLLVILAHNFNFKLGANRE